MSKQVSAEKIAYEERVHGLLAHFSRALICQVDNVSSKQMAEIRRDLRGRAVLLMGKNTLVKKCVRSYVEKTGDDKWEYLLDLLVLNVGILFVENDLNDVRSAVLANTVPAPARVGATATVDVTIPAGNTGMDPAQTSFFQALNIPTKITKGNVEIIKDVELLKVGDRVGPSHAALLAKLGVLPFEFNLNPITVFDNGAVYDCKVLDIKEEDMIKSIQAGVSNIAAFSLATGFPTLAAVPHAIINAYKNVLAIAVSTDYSFPLAEKIKGILADPEAFAKAAAAAAAAAAGASGGAAPAAAAAPEPESEEEEMELDLFG